MMQNAHPSKQLDLEFCAPKYEGKTVLVSGAGGSVGTALCEELLTLRPTRLVLFELSEFALYSVHQVLSTHPGLGDVELCPVLGSVTDAALVCSMLSKYGVQIVLHAAAYKHVPLVEANPLSGLENNVLGTQIIATAAAHQNVERFVLISSDKAVRPTSIMGGSKRLAELVVQDIGPRHPNTAFAIVRFGNVIGSSGSLVPLLHAQIDQGGPVTLTHPHAVRYFMTVDHAARLVLLAGAEAFGTVMFLSDMGAPVPIRTLAEDTIAPAGKTVRTDTRPDGDIEITYIGLRPGEKLYEELSISGRIVPTRHPGLHMVDDPCLSQVETAAMMQRLRRAIERRDEAEARAVVYNVAVGSAEQTQVPAPRNSAL